LKCDEEQVLNVSLVSSDYGALNAIGGVFIAGGRSGLTLP
jgi:hypothetical protein